MFSSCDEVAGWAAFQELSFCVASVRRAGRQELVDTCRVGRTWRRFDEAEVLSRSPGSCTVDHGSALTLPVALFGCFGPHRVAYLLVLVLMLLWTWLALAAGWPGASQAAGQCVCQRSGDSDR